MAKKKKKAVILVVIWDTATKEGKKKFRDKLKAADWVRTEFESGDGWEFEYDGDLADALNTALGTVRDAAAAAGIEYDFEAATTGGVIVYDERV